MWHIIIRISDVVYLLSYRSLLGSPVPVQYQKTLFRHALINIYCSLLAFEKHLILKYFFEEQASPCNSLGHWFRKQGVWSSKLH